MNTGGRFRSGLLVGHFCFILAREEARAEKRDRDGNEPLVRQTLQALRDQSQVQYSRHHMHRHLTRFSLIQLTGAPPSLVEIQLVAITFLCTPS